MLGNFFDNELYSDVSLRCRKDVIACHRVVLAHRSAYFEALFRHRPGPGRCLDVAPVFAGDRGLFRPSRKGGDQQKRGPSPRGGQLFALPRADSGLPASPADSFDHAQLPEPWMAVGRLGPGRYEESKRVFRSLAVSRLCDHPRLPGASLALSRLNPDELLWCLDRGLTECADRADARSLVRRYATGLPGPVEQFGPIMRSALSHCRGRSVAGPGGLLVDTALVLPLPVFIVLYIYIYVYIYTYIYIHTEEIMPGQFYSHSQSPLADRSGLWCARKVAQASATSSFCPRSCPCKRPCPCRPWRGASRKPTRRAALPRSASHPGPALCWRPVRWRA